MTQRDALGSFTHSIRDRFFSSASSTPASVFPRLINVCQHHTEQLESKKKEYHEHRVQEIINRVDIFPEHLSMKSQGLFAIGYYHQRHDLCNGNKSGPEPHTAGQLDNE